MFNRQEKARKRREAQSLNALAAYKLAALQPMPARTTHVNAAELAAFKTTSNPLVMSAPQPQPRPSRLTEMFQAVARRFQ